MDNKPHTYTKVWHKDSIRILTLLPTILVSDDNLRCGLIEGQLSERPLWVPISFAWGEPEF